MILLHSYLWWRLVRSTTAPGGRRRMFTRMLIALALLPVLAILTRRTLPIDVAAPLDWVAYSWLGVAFYLFVTLLALEPVRLAGRLWWRSRDSAPSSDRTAGDDESTTDVSQVSPSGARRVPRRDDAAAHPGEGTAPGRGAVREDGSVAARAAVRQDGSVTAGPASRRVFLARGLAATAGVVAVGTAGTGAYFANSTPVVRRVPVTLAGLDPALDCLRIVSFSDGHLSATYGGRRFERLVELVNEQEPDVVAIVGDLVDGGVEELREEVAPLADLVSKQGVFFVTGNHEYFVDTEAWLRHLPTLGIDVLRNERVAIRRGSASFDLAGIDDRTAAGSGVPGHGADLDAALDGRDDATPVVLLAHQPWMVSQARAAGVGLQISGHTHAGQLWPFDYAIQLDQPSVQGLSRHGDTQLYVTAGAGYWGPPMRIGARPEVTVVELRAPEA